MSTSLRSTFVIFALVTFLVGAPLLAVPGRFLGLVGWAPVDPILARILGAALVALAWASALGARARDRRQIEAVIQIEAVFCVLATLGVLRHLLGGANYALVVSIVALVSGLFALVWIVQGLRR
jgi:hypothetical protein